MKFYRGIKNIPLLPKGCVLTIGNFDGIHLGHKNIIKKLLNTANNNNLPSAVLFFEPQPLEFFSSNKAPARLTSLFEKYETFRNIGIDYLFCLRFSKELANLSATDFIKEILIKKFNVKHLIIGDDFHFGQNRIGNYEFLKNWNLINNQFIVEQVDTFYIDNERVSSTAIRRALNSDNLQLAKKLLGRNYSIIGKVVHGKQLGRKIGFPTANVELKRFLAPINGVYAVDIIINDKVYQGMANIGTRPTINNEQSFPRLETFIFDFNKNIYGTRIRVEFLAKIRNEIKFSSLEELQIQLKKDLFIVQNYFTKLNKFNC